MKQSRIRRFFLWQQFLLFLLLLLLLLDAFCYQQALPVQISVQKGRATLSIDSQTITLGKVSPLIGLQFDNHDPVDHEYQIDGTDNTNNFTLDTNYLSSLSSSPYYHLFELMRNLGGLSHWSDLLVTQHGRVIAQRFWPENGTRVPLDASETEQAMDPLQISLRLHAPETPVSLELLTTDDAIRISLDRNNRSVTVSRLLFSGISTTITSAFFPANTMLPFAAMVADQLIRIMITALLLLLITTGVEAAVACLQTRFYRQKVGKSLSCEQKRSAPLHLFAYLLLICSFCLLVWISLAEYHAAPHVEDASTYVFMAKMYAQGHLSVPVPKAVDRFPGPFMVEYQGQWFGQYPPGAALMLVPGFLLNIPWIVEPLLGTLALWGVGLIAARLYNRRVATLSVVLGTLSPFYSFLAASYLSHTIALFYLVWGMWALLGCMQDGARWKLPLAVICFGMASLTREQVGELFAFVVLAGFLLLYWRRVEYRRWLFVGLLSLLLLLIFVGIDLGFNWLLTGDASISPRILLSPGDHWGFGDGIGFYGLHTVAAGFVNLDELLTSLQIDLYGWPFSTTLAFLAIPFLCKRAIRVDMVLLCSMIILTAIYIGYFYHGIYLGPRYFYEGLPFFLILTARGMVTLSQTCAAVGRSVGGVMGQIRKKRESIVSLALISLLILCNLLYFFPRQIEIYHDYTGRPLWVHINLDQAYHPTVHRALVITSDINIYQEVLFPLNDPYLQGDVIYAYAKGAANEQELKTAYPDRQLFRLMIQGTGAVSYVPV